VVVKEVVKAVVMKECAAPDTSAEDRAILAEAKLAEVHIILVLTWCHLHYYHHVH
jgi:hypothetical protein